MNKEGVCWGEGCSSAGSSSLHNMPGPLKWVDSRNGAGSSTAAWRDTSENKSESVRKSESRMTRFMTGTELWASIRKKEKRFYYLTEADGNNLGIQPALLLSCGTLKSDYKEPWGRALVKMNTSFLEVSSPAFSIAVWILFSSSLL